MEKTIQCFLQASFHFQLQLLHHLQKIAMRNLEKVGKMAKN